MGASGAEDCRQGCAEQGTISEGHASRPFRQPRAVLSTLLFLSLRAWTDSREKIISRLVPRQYIWAEDGVSNWGGESEVRRKNAMGLDRSMKIGQRTGADLDHRSNQRLERLGENNAIYELTQ
jgi:hypothetical protein